MTRREARKTAILPVPQSEGRADGRRPDVNPIETAFVKLKTLLRKVAERTVEGLWTAIGRLLDAFTRRERANYFAAAGYEPI